jgi:outer membrane protein OmpA-like peptidoglycan-associated protein
MNHTPFARRLPSLLLGSTLAIAAASTAALAQEPNPTSIPAPAGAAVVTQNGDIFFYKVNVVRRDIDAVNYLHRSGSTKIGFEGTNLLPGAKGEAEVKSERGQISIDAKFSGLTPANGFGQEYLTYVLWAITPDGRPVNLGEILPAGTKSNIHVTTALQAFGLIITAEPYFAVTTPSDLIVLKNVVINDKTTGVIDKVDAKATLLPRGIYSAETDGAHTNANPITRNEKSPLELYEAYNAIRIADNAGAQQYSPDIMAKANLSLKNASDIDSSKHRDEKMEITYARGAVESAEDARVSTLRKKADERQRQELAAKERAQQEAAQAQREAAESQQQAAASQLQAQQSALAAQASQLQAAQAQAAAAQAAAAQAQAEAQKLKAEEAANAANAAAARSAAEAAATRERLREQLNKVLQTTESPRGLIVNLSDVLFDSGKYSLKPNTKLSLAKVAAILQAYPSLKLQVEGYTDSIGGDDYNQKLSENRANTVKDFLISQGTDPNSITSAGYGKADPVADNGTAAGRAQNRRVDLIVSGDAIGVKTTTPDIQ